VAPERLRNPDSLKALQDWNPDVIVVVAFGKLLPAVVLQLPPMGCVNVHASLLPRHRGASPIPAAILAGDRHTGVSTMLLDEGMDTGDILLKQETPIEEIDTAGTLHDKLMELGADLAVETLRQMTENKLQPIPQNSEEATYTRLLTRNDGRFDWTADARHLDRVVRAMNPWPVAFFRFGSDDIKVWRARPVEGRGEPGRVEEILGDGIAVGTGEGLLSLQEVQAPGKKRVPAVDFARGRRLHVGDVFE
jgi:methionyl-tRNA formyltransferase